MLDYNKLELYKKYLNTIQSFLDKYFEDQKEYICCQKGCAHCCEKGAYPYSQIEFDYLMIMGGDYETLSDIEYQERLYDFIVSIINNEDLDYISKLDKLKCFIDTNKSLELYSRERWKF